MRVLSLDLFAPHIGTAYEVVAGDGGLELVLEKAESLPQSGRPGGSFRLEFSGPPDPVLPQAIYRFRRSEEEDDIFIVPVERSAQATLYEAIFF